MSVTREEDRQKNGCPSRGLGIAAAAIGVGVGAALYYFFNKRAENPDSEGSTSDWNCERPQPFHLTPSSDDSYTTISEHETTDTSIHDHEFNGDYLNDSTDMPIAVSDHSDSVHDSDSAHDSDSIHDSDSSASAATYIDSDSLTGSAVTYFDSDSLSGSAVTYTDSDSDISDFDVTSSSLGVPEESDRSRSPIMSLLGSASWFWTSRVSPRRRTHLTEEEQMAMIRQEQFRERSWTLEECSICFDVMLRNQEVTQLPCAHNFHTECIMPWLQEKQTCPNCRKAAE